MDYKLHYTFGQFVRDLARYVAPYRGQFWMGVFLRFTSDLARLYPAWAVARIVTILAGGVEEGEVVRLAWVFGGWGVAGLYFGITHNLSKYFGYQVAEKAGLDLYKECLAHLFRLDFAWQEGENSGNKMKRVDKGQEGVNSTIRRVFDVLIEVGVNTVGIVVIFTTLEVRLAWGLVGFVVSYFVVGTALLKRAIAQEQVVNAAFENLGGVTFEALNNMQTIKSLGIDSGVNRMVSRYVGELVEKIRRRIALFQSQHGILYVYEIAFEFIVAVWLVLEVVAGRADVSLLVLFVGLFGKVVESAGELTDVTQELVLARVWVSRAMAILKTVPEIEHPEKLAWQREYPQDWERIVIDDVKFGYKRGRALKGVSIEIRRGERVGIVGLSGAGKSTLFKLLLDLYEDYEGEIRVGGVELKEMQRQSYIDHVAVVLQDTELFDMTLKENIEIAGVGRGEAREGLLGEVVRMAHLDDVVARLPQGWDTVVGEKGIRLSGGQRQRVGIARALYRQPDILLLDEATSHLDAHSEREIQKALEECMQRFTTVVIAHRLSTIKSMDKIVVLDHGRVVEEGTFDELLARLGAFARMWQEQKI